MFSMRGVAVAAAMVAVVFAAGCGSDEPKTAANQNQVVDSPPKTADDVRDALKAEGLCDKAVAIRAGEGEWASDYAETVTGGWWCVDTATVLSFKTVAARDQAASAIGVYVPADGGLLWGIQFANGHPAAAQAEKAMGDTIKRAP